MAIGARRKGRRANAKDPQIDALAQTLAPKIPLADEDEIEHVLWSDLDDSWSHLVVADNEEAVVSALAKAIAAIKAPERREIAEALHKLGYKLIGTGGGCEAYYLAFTKEEDEGPHILITDTDCRPPVTWTQEVLIGSYRDFGDLEDQETYDNVRELVDVLRGGKDPRWQAAPPVSSQDLDLINRHRAKIGMAPIDPTAGWTAREIAEMARSIRETGRMANAPVAALKRSLTKI